MDSILSILAQAFMAGIVLACVFMAGTFVIKSRGQTVADFLSKKIASGAWLFISGFVGDLIAYLTLA